MNQPSPHHTPAETTIDPQTPLTDNTDANTRHYIARLRFQFLTPVIVTLSLTVMVIIATIYLHEHQSIDSGVIQLQSTAMNLYQNNIQQNTRALQTVMAVLRTNRELASALAEKDRQKLLQRSAPLYSDIHRHYGVTHLYFSGPDRINLLRTHKPQKYGDTIDRQTTLTAEKSGADAHGVELGPLGTLTLRYVQPWYDQQTQELLGFVELGMEVDQAFNAIRDLFGLDLFLLIHKKYLEQRGWEEGMRTFGRLPDWRRFPQTVVSVHGKQLLPGALSAHILATDLSAHQSPFQVELGQISQHAIFQPIPDVSGRSVGTMVMLVDTSVPVKHARESIIIGSIAVIVAASVLLSFFYWFVGRIGERMARDESQLQKMATHDGLTGLLNRQQFDLMLDDLIARCARYGRPASLLMIDIDYFKRVNDTHGHQAGDAVLVELGRRLMDHTRVNDRVYRYGGEEFAILLPETDPAGASLFAQRLCETLANEPCDLSDGTQLSITVSIGVASCPDHANAAQTLISAADKALYTAKQTGRNRVAYYGDLT